MYKLKLKKGLSFKSATLAATKDSPFCTTESEEVYRKAIASGRFELVPEAVVKQSFTTEQEDDSDLFTGDADVSKMTAAECKAFAAEHGIDIEGLTKVADLRKKISEELEEGIDDEQSPFEE